MIASLLALALPFISIAGAYETTSTSSSGPKQVGKGSDEAARAARSKKWQNIALAGAATVIAVGLVVMVSHNHSKHAHR